MNLMKRFFRLALYNYSASNDVLKPLDPFGTEQKKSSPI